MTRTRRPAGSRAHPVTTTLGSAFEDGRSDVEGLYEEMNDWASNMEGNSMEHLPKYDEVTEARDALETANDTLGGIEPPDAIADLEVHFTTDTRQNAQSRSGRMGNVLQALGAAKDAAEAWMEENPELEVSEPDEEFIDGNEPLEEEEKVTQEQVEEREAARTEVEEFLNELDSAISEAEGVSFPGMY